MLSLCEKSHLKDLCKILKKKFKQIKKLNFVLRRYLFCLLDQSPNQYIRADYMNESDILAPYIPRLSRVHHLRLELPRFWYFQLTANSKNYFIELRILIIKELFISASCLVNFTHSNLLKKFSHSKFHSVFLSFQTQ